MVIEPPHLFSNEYVVPPEEDYSAYTQGTSAQASVNDGDASAEAADIYVTAGGENNG